MNNSLRRDFTLVDRDISGTLREIVRGTLGHARVKGNVGGRHRQCSRGGDDAEERECELVEQHV